MQRKSGGGARGSLWTTLVQSAGLLEGSGACCSKSPESGSVVTQVTHGNMVVPMGMDLPKRCKGATGPPESDLENEVLVHRKKRHEVKKTGDRVVARIYCHDQIPWIQGVGQ